MVNPSLASNFLLRILASICMGLLSAAHLSLENLKTLMDCTSAHKISLGYWEKAFWFKSLTVEMSYLLKFLSLY